MKIEAPERFESVNLYLILETQVVTEIDSPVPSLDFTIAEKRTIYEFFPSEAEAQKYIQSLRLRYISKNQTLKLITSGSRFERGGSWLDGRVDHHFAHTFEINHSVECQNIPVSELSEGIEKQLKNPQRRILKDERGIHPFYNVGTPTPDFSRIVLF